MQYHNRAAIVLHVFAGTLFPGLAASGALYSVRDLGPFSNLPGRSDSRPNSINAAGDVAGANVSGGAYQAFLYTGSWTNLGTLGGSEALAAAVNDSRRVAGYSTTGSGVKHAFLWTPGGSDGIAGNPRMKDLGTLGGEASEAYAINRNGQVAGYSQTTGRDHAFLYSMGTLTDIGSLLSGPRHSYAYAINAAGHVAGTAYNNAYSSYSAFFFNGTTAVDIGESGTDSSALAMNDADHIVGYTTVNGLDEAFHYFNGSMHSLGTLGGNYSYAIGINNSNVIVGGSFIDATDKVYHAFVCTNDVLIDLNTQLDETGAGWVLIEARAINDANQIVGTGKLNGANRQFMLSPTPTTPPPPPPAPEITGIVRNGADWLVEFTTSGAVSYALEGRTNMAEGTWVQLVGNIPGTGGSVTVTNSANAPAQFFRIKAAAP